MLMAWVTSPTQFYLLRFLMGAFEAGLQPAFFVSASAISLMVGSPLAAYVMSIFDGIGGHKGWQWLFHSVVREAGYTDIKTLGWVMSAIFACG